MKVKSFTTMCGYCGARLDESQAWQHVAEHYRGTTVYVNVVNLRAELLRHRPGKSGELLIERASPQPPQNMLVAAVRQAGGALNRSGIYPASLSIWRWLSQYAVEWE
jgi:hypothetical protein